VRLPFDVPLEVLHSSDFDISNMRAVAAILKTLVRKQRAVANLLHLTAHATMQSLLSTDRGALSVLELSIVKQLLTRYFGFTGRAFAYPSLTSS